MKHLYLSSNTLKHDWSFISRKRNANDAYTSFIEMSVKIYCAHFPFRTFRPSKKIKKQWVTSVHLGMIRKKNSLYHNFLNARTMDALKEFKAARNKSNSELRRAKAAYFEHPFLNVTRKKPEATWKAINRALGRQNKNAAPKTIISNNRELSGQELTDHFNNVFVNGTMSDHSLPFTAPSINAPVNSFVRHRVTEEEVCRTFMQLNNSKALDINNVQIKPVKYVLQSTVLTYIFNLIIEDGEFPTEIKKSRVMTMYNVGDRNDAKNYRPISVIPVFSKGLEKILSSTRSLKFFDRMRLFSDVQYGFRKGRSTENALLTLKKNVLENIEDRVFTLCLFIKFYRAFDSISHDILLQKLHLHGVRGTPLNLIRSYLHNRSQCVQVGNRQSSFIPINTRVPQGSIL